MKFLLMRRKFKDQLRVRRKIKEAINDVLARNKVRSHNEVMFFHKFWSRWQLMSCFQVLNRFFTIGLRDLNEVCIHKEETFDKRSTETNMNLTPSELCEVSL